MKVMKTYEFNILIKSSKFVTSEEDKKLMHMISSSQVLKFSKYCIGIFKRLDKT